MKINVIIDGSFLMYKNVFILQKIRRINQDLLELLENDLKKIRKSLPFDNIFFVSDSKESNWRKILYKEYKGKRKKDDSIDWQSVYDIYNQFKDKVKKQRNIKFLELSGLEGDDFISYIIKEYNKKGYSNLIVASDRDLNQLLTHNIKEKWLNFQWNYKFNDERVYLPENYQLVINEISNNMNENLFDLNVDSEFVEYIENLVSRTKTKIVTSEEICVTKILQGDSGDNIPTCIKIKDGKVNPNGRGIGESGAQKIYKLYKEIHPEKIDLDSDVFINNLADIIIFNKKIKDNTAKDVIINQLKFNRKMIFLDSKYMPESIYQNMKEYFKSIDNRVIEYEPEDLEQKLDDDDFFAEEKDFLPEQFNKENNNEKFDPDDFWEL